MTILQVQQEEELHFRIMHDTQNFTDFIVHVAIAPSKSKSKKSKFLSGF